MASLIDTLNTSNPNAAPSAMQSAKIGDALNVSAGFFAGTVTSNILTLPSPAGCAVRVYAMSGSVVGPCTILAESATLATTECKVNALGNISFFATDAVTSAYVFYHAAGPAAITQTVNVASSAALFAGSNRSLRLVSVTVDTGLVLGSKTVLSQGATPSAGQVALNAAGTGLTFNATDVVTGTATAVYIPMPGYGTTEASLATRLQASVGF